MWCTCGSIQQDLVCILDRVCARVTRWVCFFVTWSAKSLYLIEMDGKMMDNNKDRNELSKDRVIKFWR